FSGVTTIAGGKLGRGGGHVDGPSEDAKFSNDFDVVYVGSSCSLLVIDRGNQAIREIQLRFDDCAYQYESGFPLGIAMLIGAGFFGYMLALLQRRLSTIVASQDVSLVPSPLLSAAFIKSDKYSLCSTDTSD
ncbi:NHL domain-containing protein, partial [Trifolium pratense]